MTSLMHINYFQIPIHKFYSEAKKQSVLIFEAIFFIVNKENLILQCYITSLKLSGFSQFWYLAR